MSSKKVNKNDFGGVNLNQENTVFREKEWYREKIIEIVKQIDDKKFLNQIRTILKKYIEKRGS